jgi:hypothetical protein
MPRNRGRRGRQPAPQQEYVPYDAWHPKTPPDVLIPPIGSLAEGPVNEERFVRVPYEKLKVGNWYYGNEWESRDGGDFVLLLSLEPFDYWGRPGKRLLKVYKGYAGGFWGNPTFRWSEGYKRYTTLPMDDFWLPKTPVKDTIESKAQVQAVKDVLASKGVPDEMGTGPLGNILKMADIKAPPRGSTAGRRTRKHMKRSRKTRRR